MSQSLSIGSTTIELPDTLAAFARQEPAASVLLAAELEWVEAGDWCQGLLSPLFLAEQGWADSLAALAGLLQAWLGGWPVGLEGQGEAAAALARCFGDTLKTACQRVGRDAAALERIFFARHGAGYRLASLDRIVPVSSAEQARPALRLEFSLAPAAGASAQTGLRVGVVYRPDDVEADCCLLGDTRGLGRDGGGRYLPRQGGLADCPSVAEILNQDLGVDEAFPTYVVWPAVSGSVCACAEEAYGYVQHLEQADTLEHRLAQGKDEVAAYYRRFGRLAALAYVFCLERLDGRHFLLRRRKPYLIGLETAFSSPFSQLADTGLFDPASGPLLAKAAPWQLLEGKPTAPKPVDAKKQAEALRAGCLEGLQALARCAERIEARLSGLRPRAFARPAQEWRRLFAETLPTLGGDRRFGGLELVEAMAERESQARRREWTLAWFGKLLGGFQDSLKQAEKNLAADKEAQAALKAFKTELARQAGVANFNQVSAEKLAQAAGPELAQRWAALCGFADYLSWRLALRGYETGLARAWDVLPRYVLKPCLAKAASPCPAAAGAKLPSLIASGDRLPAAPPSAPRPDCRAFVPLRFSRRLDDDLLLDANGEAVGLEGQPPVPAPPRAAFFPAPMAPEIAARLQAAGQRGFQDNLLAQITLLLK